MGGVSFPRLSLFSGEIFAGWMANRYPNANVDTQTAPTFGGSISWLPTEDISVTLAASQQIGLSGPTQGTAFTVVNGIPGALPPTDPLAAASPAAAANAQATQVSNALIAPGTVVNQQLFASAGSSSKTTTVSLGARYLATQALTTGATMTWQTSSGSSLNAAAQGYDVFVLRLNADYSLTATWGLSGTYSYARTFYDQPGLDYTQNVFTFGVTGRL